MPLTNEIGRPIESTSTEIRRYMFENKETSPSDFHNYINQYRDVKYNSVAKYFYVLRKLGLIEISRKEERNGGFPKIFYKLVERQIENIAWNNPQESLYGKGK
jgi:hypothetical protein